MKNILTAFAIIIFVANSLYAQNIKVIDKNDKLPIPNVQITNMQNQRRILTDNNGFADMSIFNPNDTLILNHIVYKKLKTTSLTIQNNNNTVELEEKIIRLNEIVFSANRWKQTSDNIPARIISISPKQIQLQNPQTTADLLSNSGEVFVQKSQAGGGSPMIRGFATNRLLYSVDGIRMNTAIFRAGNIQNVISLDAFSIENTEVMFGPGSIIYGSDAIGGVMSFQTLTPQLSNNDKPLIKGSTTMRYASANNEKTGHFDINIANKKIAMLTSITYSDFGDLRMGAKGPDEYLRTFYVQRIDNADVVVTNENPLVQKPTGYSQTNIMQKIRYKPNNSWDVNYGFHYSITSDYSRYDRLIELSKGLPRSAVWNYGPQKWMMNNVSITNQNTNKLYDEMTIRLAHQYFEESRIDRNFSGSNRFRLRTQLEEVQAYSANIDFHKTSDKHKLFYGIEFVQNDVTSKGSAIDIRTNDQIPVSDRYPQSVWKSYGAYLSYQYLLSEKFIVQSGIRYNQFDLSSDFSRNLQFYPFNFSKAEINNNATTGTLGIIIKPEESWTISINGATGFRAPNVDDIGKIFDFAAGEVVMPNPNLNAEYAYNGELNISKIFGDIFKVNLSAFYTYLDNAMVRREYTINGADSIMYNGELSKVYAIQNASYAKVYGGSIGLELKLTNGIGFSSVYNYQKGEEEMDNGKVSSSRHAAPAFGITRISYNYDKISLELNTMYCAEVSYSNLNEEERLKPFIYAIDNNGNPYSPNWYTLNIKASYKINEKLSINAGLENITDQRYRTYSSGIVAPGRNFIMSFKASI